MLSVMVLVKVSAMVWVTAVVMVAEYFYLNMKNFESFDFVPILVFAGSLVVVLSLEVTNDSFYS